MQNNATHHHSSVLIFFYTHTVHIGFIASSSQLLHVTAEPHQNKNSYYNKQETFRCVQRKTEEALLGMNVARVSDAEFENVSISSIK